MCFLFDTEKHETALVLLRYLETSANKLLNSEQSSSRQLSTLKHGESPKYLAIFPTYFEIRAEVDALSALLFTTLQNHSLKKCMCVCVCVCEEVLHILH